MICNSPVKANKRGRGNMSLTCGSAECLSEVQKQVAGRRAEAIHWPAVEEPVAVPDFSAHNLKFKPALGSVRVNAEDRQSYSGCSAAWTAGV